jgi:twinfilin
MSHQTGIKSDDNLRKYFAKSKEGKIRMIKVTIRDEVMELDTHREITDKSDWKLDYNECVLKNIDNKTPCYIFYRLDEKTNSGYQWLFIAWSPDLAPIKQKMLYAATKQTIKLEFGAGQIKDELFGTAKEDVSLDVILIYI